MVDIELHVYIVSVGVKWEGRIGQSSFYTLLAPLT